MLGKIFSPLDEWTRKRGYQIWNSKQKGIEKTMEAGIFGVANSECHIRFLIKLLFGRRSLKKNNGKNGLGFKNWAKYQKGGFLISNIALYFDNDLIKPSQLNPIFANSKSYIGVRSKIWCYIRNQWPREAQFWHLSQLLQPSQFCSIFAIFEAQIRARLKMVYDIRNQKSRKPYFDSLLYILFHLKFQSWKFSEPPFGE